MGQLALGIAGAVVGSFFGMPQLGFMIGSLVGGLLFPQKVEGPRLEDLKIQDSAYGKAIPILYGTMRLAGNVIWQIPQLNEHEQKSGGKGGPEVTNYAYSASWAVAWTAGPVLGIKRKWAAGKLVYDIAQGSSNQTFPYTLYLGNESQLPDPTMEAYLGVGEVPAHRGNCYSVFDDVYLTDYGNTIPLLEAEVYTSAGVFPYRVSTFDPAQFNTSNDILQCASWDAANERIVVGGYDNPTDDYRENYFNDDGTSAGSEYVAALDAMPTGTPQLAAVATNAQMAFCYANGHPEMGAWYHKERVVVTVTQNPSGGHPFSAAVDEPLLQGDYMYALSSNTFSGIGGIARWSCPSGDQGAIVGVGTDYVSLGVNPQSLVIGSSDDGNVYVSDTTNFLLSAKLYEFDAELNLLRTWDAGDTPAGFKDNRAFVVYKGMLAFRNDVTDDFDLYSMGTTFDFIATIDIAPGNIQPVVRIRNGYVLIGDGLVCLDPPESPAILSDIVADLSDRCGLAAYDTSALTDEVRGFLVASPMTALSAIEALRKAYFFDGVEIDNVITFVKRGGASEITITADDLAAHGEGSEAPAQLLLTRTPEAELPRAVSVKYIDPERDYQVNTVKAVREVTSSVTDVTIELPISMSTGKARAIANTLLYEAWIERDRYAFYTNRKFATMVPTTVAIVLGVRMRILSKTEMPGGVFRWEAVAALAEIYTQLNDGIDGQGFPVQTPPGITVATELVLLDIPLVADNTADGTAQSNVGFYAAMGPVADGRWNGASLYESVDNGTTWTAIASQSTADVIGTMVAPLADYGGGNVMDASTVLEVTLHSGTLISVTDDALMNGANMCVVGKELLQFRDASLVSPLTYECTNLLRGRRGTEAVVPAHGEDELFVLMPVTQIKSSPSSLFQSRLYKAVTAGSAIASASAVTFANMGASARPYSPVHVQGAPNASDDIVIDWVRRTRIGGIMNAFGDVPLSEVTEAYVLQVWNAGYSECARIIQVAVPTATYPSADQVTDFGALQQEVYVSVGQVGSYQLGSQTRATIPGAGASIDSPLAPITPFNASPNPPPGGSGGAVNQTISTYPFGTAITNGVVVGDTYVVQITSSATPVSTRISVAEYSDPPTYRKCVLASDVNGNNPVAPPFWGNTATVYFTPAASTIYYVIIKVELPDGTTGRPLGEGADFICEMGSA